MNDSLENLLANDPTPLDRDVQLRLLEFYKTVLEENESQNLTRLTSPRDFYYGHLQDVRQLLTLGWIQYPAMDLGSGAGIPGLLAALIEKGEWILAESEKRKAEYLQRAVNTLGLSSQVSVYSGRAEKYLLSKAVQSITARGVGPISRIYSWIRKCSTWNNLILFKGPQWDDEWAQFRKTQMGNELTLKAAQSYLLGPEEKKRIVVLLMRVPRGTMRKF
jgi:16S rRNA (guanine527-N7)-methyltransferase